MGARITMAAKSFHECAHYASRSTLISRSTMTLLCAKDAARNCARNILESHYVAESVGHGHQQNDDGRRFAGFDAGMPQAFKFISRYR